MVRPLKVTVWGTLVCGALLLLSSLAMGRTGVEAGYSKRQTYNAALRYLRVDLGYEVSERDSKAAYLLFRYAPVGRRELTRGAIEIIDANDRVKVVVSLPEMPKYHEQILIDGLLKKLRSEYGEPPPRRKQKSRRGRQKRPQADAGA